MLFFFDERENKTIHTQTHTVKVFWLHMRKEVTDGGVRGGGGWGVAQNLRCSRCHHS